MSKGTGWRQWLGIILGGAYAFSASCAIAQVTPDQTLPNNSSVTQAGSIFNITGGTQAGRNLFHSFQLFSVPTGGTASFNNGLDIQNIFSRVTGGSVSNIDGIIHANGTANLFFLNPNGIVFGKNASLNIGGSFVGTTANAIQFGNLGIFSASEPNNPALLTINPSALLYNQIAVGASIQNSSQATVNGNVTGLQVPDGKSLLLVGGNVNLDGGGLTANGGRVELAGLAAPGNIGLNVAGDTLSLSVPSDVQRSNISLSNQALVDVSGAGGGDIAVNASSLEMSNSFLYAGIGTGLGDGSTKGGDININADSISLLNGAEIAAFTQGKGDAGNIFIAARDAISMDSGFIANLVPNGAVGNAGNIQVQAGNILAKNQGGIGSTTQGKGNSGNISIAALNTISLDNGAIFSNVSSSNAIGNAGNINIKTGLLTATNGAQINSLTTGKGDAGNISITALNGISLDAASYILSNVQSNNAQGNAGNINITTGSLTATRGAQINSSTRGKGNAGNVTITATGAVAFDGVDSNGFQSGSSSEVLAGGVGNGGNINITAGSLSLTNSGELNVSVREASNSLASGQGQGGTVNVNVRDALTISGTDSEISGSLDTGAVGRSGDIQVQAGNIFVKDGGYISSSTLGKGDSGNISITARDAISLDRAYIANSVQDKDAFGNAGKIDITTGSLSVTNGAEINSFTRGRGNAGNVTIIARNAVTFDGVDSDGNHSASFSVIDRGAVGNGGNINITAGSLSLTNGGELGVDVNGASNSLAGGQGQGGTVNVNVRDALTISGTGSEISGSLDTGAVGRSGDIQVQAGNIFVKDGGQIISSTFGKGDSGNISITARNGISLDAASYIANSVQSHEAEGNAGKIDITTGSLSATHGAEINSFTSGKGNAGNVTIQAKDAVTFDGVDSNGNRSASFSEVQAGAVGNSGNINITAGSLSLTNGGLLGVFLSNASNDLSGSQGLGGTVNINVREALTISGTGSGINSALGTGAVGRGGDINIQAGNFFVRDGGQINSSTYGIGNGGNITVNATDLVEFVNGSLYSNTYLRGGRTGDVNIKSKRLISTSSQIGTSTSGEGDVGNLTVIASDSVELSGEVGKGDVNGVPGLLFAQVESTGKGQGGNLYLETRRLSISDGSKVQVATFGAGNAGNLFVRADEIDIFDTDKPSFYSTGLFAGNQLDRRVEQGFIKDPNNGNITGQGGNLTVETRTLNLRNGGEVFVATSGEGNAGRSLIQASDSVNITGTSISPIGTQRFSTITAGTSNASTGNGGSLTIETRQLNITNGGQITSSSLGQGKAGDINLIADTARLNNGQITAQTTSSDGGNINFNLSQYLLLRNRSLISTTAGTAEKDGNGGNITINTPFLVAVPNENNDITANAFNGSGGKIQINATGIFGLTVLSREDLVRLLGTNDLTQLDLQRLPINAITAISQTNPTLSGTVVIDTANINPSQELVPLSTNLINPNTLIANSCIARTKKQRGTFNITGAGGLPNRPGDASISSYPTGTVRNVEGNSTSSSWHKGDPIVEPQGVYQLPNGHLVLSRECS